MKKKHNFNTSFTKNSIIEEDEKDDALKLFNESDLEWMDQLMKIVISDMIQSITVPKEEDNHDQIYEDWMILLNELRQSILFEMMHYQKQHQDVKSDGKEEDLISLLFKRSLSPEI